MNIPPLAVWFCWTYLVCYWVAPLTISTLIQKLAVFIFWPLDHAQVIGHVLSTRHSAVIQYNVTLFILWLFSISFFLLLRIWKNEINTTEMMPSLRYIFSSSKRPLLPSYPCIIRDVCHVTFPHDGVMGLDETWRRTPAPPGAGSGRLIRWKCRVCREHITSVTESWPPHAWWLLWNCKLTEEWSRFQNAYTAFKNFRN